LVEPPDYMPEGGKAAWRYALECAPPHLLKKLDMSVLEIWACAADLYRKAWESGGRSSAPLCYKLAFNELKARDYTGALDTAREVLKASPDYPRIKEEVMQRAWALVRP
jgi:phage terminase small subunit